jgi:multidrug efflux system membrane fusion protein
MTDSSAATPPPDPSALDAARPPGRRLWPWLLLAVLAGGAYMAHKWWVAAPSASSATANRADNARAVPVLAGQVQRRDVKQYLAGLLGTVVALNTVTIHSRVDGQLEKVAYREGEFVHEGDVLAELDPRPFEVQLEQAKGQKVKDEATLANARLDLERYKVLFAQDSVAKQQLDTQAATVAQDEGVLVSDQAAIDTANLNLTYCHITSPLTGRIGLRLVDPGNIVHAADANGLIVITQVQPISVVFPIPEDALPRVVPKVRSGVRLDVDAFDRGGLNLLATGTVLTLDNQLDTSTTTVRVRAVFANTNEALFPNQFVNARLLIDTLHNVVVVPSAAVQRGAQATYVFVIKPDNTVDMRTVTVQLSQGDDTVVSSGVSPGETVVTDGLDKLQPGTHVQLRPASASGSGTKAGTASSSSSGSGSSGSSGASSASGGSGRL